MQTHCCSMLGKSCPVSHWWCIALRTSSFWLMVGEFMRWVKKPVDDVLRMQHVTIMKTAAVHSRIQPEIKEQAERILQRLGLSPTEAIRMFYTQIALRNGLPFDVAIPNEETIKALEDSRNGRNLERFDSTEELFESWNA
jgi:DNA-damage-inducible protein J